MTELIETKRENNYFIPMGSFFQIMSEKSALEENAKLVVPVKTTQEKSKKQEKINAKK